MRILFIKSITPGVARVKAHTRKDGVFVAEHTRKTRGASDNVNPSKTGKSAEKKTVDDVKRAIKPDQSDPKKDEDSLRPGETLWLRYGLPPESGKSRHVQHGYEEDGVSVMIPLGDLGRSQWTQQMVFSMTAGEMGTRELYVVAGKKRNHNPYAFGGSGFGSDGEPLIDDARVIRAATPKERHLLVRDMESVAVNQFGFDRIPGLYAALKSEDPDK